MDYISYGLLGLFILGFLSATLLPLASEGALLAILFAGYDPTSTLVTITIANTLGSYTNYWIGVQAPEDFIKKRFQKEERYNRLIVRIKKYGPWLGLLSWVPILGDPLTLALGYFRVPFFKTALLILLAKFLRYLLIILLWLYA